MPTLTNSVSAVDVNSQRDVNVTTGENIKKPNIDESWFPFIGSEFEKDYMLNLKKFLANEYSTGKTIYPAKDKYFNAFNLTPFDKVKVVILGQDPYHGPGQAHGLSFSVPEGTALPPSLQNIFKELESDLKWQKPGHGNLEKWAQQGVFLLNSVLTVENGKAASHQGKGWEQFTDVVIQKLSEHRSNLVFLLWGSYAQKKAAFVDRKKHLVLESPHPSPLSSYRGFFGSKPFSKINNYLVKNGQNEIQW